MYSYRARVVRIKDGDTIVVDVDLGFKAWAHDQEIRLLGIQAPESSTAPGSKATAFLKDTLPLGAVIELSTVKDKREKYGRMLGDVFLEGLHINKHLIDSGHAVAWDGRGVRPHGF